ncbi:MAG: hypothetical protein EXR99_15685 [Gemmataceae bacterium]|nr:hypothetical protein [Gemmataceae bacterium]
MRWSMGILCLVFSCGYAADALAQDTPLAIVQKGIEAQGGKAALAKAAIVKRTSKGKSFIGAEQEFTDTFQLALPERMKFTLNLGKENFSMCLDGDKGWALIGGFPNDLPKDKVDEMKGEAYFLHVVSLTPLLDSKAVLTSGQEGKVGTKPAAVVKARLGAGTEVTLHFDKETGLLLRAERKATQSGVEVLKAVDYLNYQAFGAARMATKETHYLGPNRLAEIQDIRYEFQERVDPAVFKKP